MTNKDRYKQAFSALLSSQQFQLKEEEMAQIHNKHKKNIAVAAAIACAVVIGGSGTVYAADIGGIQEKLSIWLYGKQTEVNVTENDNGDGYVFVYDQGNGKEGLSVYSGVSINTDGSRTQLAANELATRISESASVQKDEDGKIWVYFVDQKLDITDMFDKNGICHTTMTHEGKTVHLTITENKYGGYSLSQTDDLAESETSTSTTTTTTNIITTGD